MDSYPYCVHRILRLASMGIGGIEEGRLRVSRGYPNDVGGLPKELPCYLYAHMSWRYMRKAHK